MTLRDYAHALAPGTTLVHYRIQQVLGAGGFGITYLAEELPIGRPVAIKEYLPADMATRGRDGSSVVPLDMIRSKGFAWGLSRFVDEARTLARFEHPNIVSVFTFFEANGTAYYAMRLVEGRPLDKILADGEALEPARLRALLDPLLDGLGAVHEAGFLHRDIKPGNICIGADGRPVLIDFGAARMAFGEQSKTLTAVVSPGYAPFEQYHGDGHQGPWTDLYALGATLYRCMTGRVPPESTVRINASARQRPDPMVPVRDAARRPYDAALLDAVDRALRVHEEERPQSVEAFRRLLARAPTGDGASAPPPVVAAARAWPAPAPRSALVVTGAPDSDSGREDASSARVEPVSSPLEPEPESAAGRKQRAPARAGPWAGFGIVLAAAAALGLYFIVGTEAPPAAPQAEPKIVPQPDPPKSEARIPGEMFRDCPDCPELVVVPAGGFTMGAPEGEPDSTDDERPPRNVSVAKPFAIGKFEVTFAEYDACTAAGGCKQRPDDEGWGRGRLPVIHMAWSDAKEYVAWLSRRTGKTYRLPSEAEWEYAARAGTNTAYAWGAEIPAGAANCDGCGSTWDSKSTAPVGSFAANAWGLHDMNGNAAEWTEDCWHDRFVGAPADTRPWIEGGACRHRVLRGGSWFAPRSQLRSAHRLPEIADDRGHFAGFRVVRVLD